MRIRIELTEKDLRELVHTELRKKLGDDANVTPESIEIQVKSKQNYRSEWETAYFRAVYDGSV